MFDYNNHNFWHPTNTYRPCKVATAAFESIRHLYVNDKINWVDCIRAIRNILIATDARFPLFTARRITVAFGSKKFPLTIKVD